MSRPPGDPSPREQRRLREAAVEYARHGWPVVALAVPTAEGCPCGGEGCEVTHPVGDLPGGITSVETAQRVWSDHPWSVGLVTARFDVLDLSGLHGSRIHAELKIRCPAATARPGRRHGWLIEPGPVRWHLYLAPGGVDPGKVAAAGGRLHTGPGDWVPAPPSRTPEAGPVSWIVPPGQARWTPYRRADVFDRLGLA